MAASAGGFNIGLLCSSTVLNSSVGKGGNRADHLRCFSSVTEKLELLKPRSKLSSLITDHNERRARDTVAVSVYNPNQKIDFSLEDDEVSPDIIPSPPPSEGRLEIILDNKAIREIDLSQAHEALLPYISVSGKSAEDIQRATKDLMDRKVGFTINYEREDPLDPRELSELPDVRVWFVRLDATYPWLPAVLDWRAGELARYAAMLVPHQMSRRLGLVFNPEALELFVMRKNFITYDWLRSSGISRPEVFVKAMMQVLGFTIDDVLYKILEESPPPSL